jgi:carboxylate-amine ligase
MALSANSPVYDGRDTGWASWRYRIVARWPTARLPAVWPDAAAYDATVRHLIRDGAAFDESSVYFHARLSPQYPTVEIRIADVCPDIGMTLLVAALARALVVTALEEVNTRAPLPKASPQALVAGLTASARFGLAGTGVDPFTGEPVSQRDLLNRLLEHVS